MSSTPSSASLNADCALKQLRSHMAGYYPYKCQSNNITNWFTTPGKNPQSPQSPPQTMPHLHPPSQQQIIKFREQEYAEFDKKRAIHDEAITKQFWINEKKLNRTPAQQKIDYQKFVRNVIDTQNVI